MQNSDLQKFIEQVEKSFGTDFKVSKEKGVGIITSYKDGVIEISDINSLKMGEVVEIIETETKAVVLSLNKNSSKALILDDNKSIKEGLQVKSSGVVLSVSPSEDYIGRVVDSLGRPVDGEGEIKQGSTMDLESTAPGVFARESVDTSLHTGIVAVDSLIPIGRGQRELIIGDRQTGKTSIAIDTILSQKDENIICIYCAIGQRESNVSKIYQTLETEGALKHTIIVSAPSSSTAMMQFLCPYTATAIGEYFLKQGKEVLIVYDDLSKHAVSYREVSLILRRPPGREAYPGDVFYIHSRLLERSVKLNKEHGGGSITSLPIIETQAGDVSAYIPTNVISITDGQIFLESSLFNKGVVPAINAGISVSRVGSAAQTKIMKKIAGTLKLDLASYYELEAFSQFSSELDEDTKQTLNRGRKIVNSLVQPQNTPYKLWQEVIVIWAVTKGFLDNTEDTEIVPTIKNVLTKFESNCPSVITLIQKDKDLTPEIEKGLNKFFKEFFSK
jgi:F-type H+-transporting ATPase subunit alpha